MPCVIKPCSCDHKWQDQKYGKGMRVHNAMGPKTNGAVKCTVCGSKK